MNIILKKYNKKNIIIKNKLISKIDIKQIYKNKLKIIIQFLLEK